MPEDHEKYPAVMTIPTSKTAVDPARILRREPEATVLGSETGRLPETPAGGSEGSERFRQIT